MHICPIFGVLVAIRACSRGG